jgi:flagellar basal-body rod protein FlgB
MINKIFSKFDYYKKALDASTLKSEAIANNMANVNTPNYKKETVDFDGVLKSYIYDDSVTMSKTNEMHMDINNNFEPQISKITDSEFRRDGNNVDMDVEMAELAKNQIKYNAVTQQLSDQIKRLKYVIREGR